MQRPEPVFLWAVCLVWVQPPPSHLCTPEAWFLPLQNGLNALHLAAKEGHVGLVQELLGRGSAVDSATKVTLVLGGCADLERGGGWKPFPWGSTSQVGGNGDSRQAELRSPTLA